MVPHYIGFLERQYQMSKCSECNKKVKVNSKFCQNCGTELSKQTHTDKAKKILPKFVYCLYTIIFISIIILSSYIVSSPNKYSLFHPIIVVFILFPVGVINVILTIFLLAKKYRKEQIILPLFSISGIFVWFVGWFLFRLWYFRDELVILYYLYSSIGIIIALYFIWKE